MKKEKLNYFFVFWITFFPLMGFAQSWSEYNAQGLKEQKNGQYQKSIHYFEKALSLIQKKQGKQSIEYIAVLTNMGTTYREMENYEKAEYILQNAADIAKKSFGSKHVVYGHTLSVLAALYQTQGQYVQAEQLYLQAIAIDSISNDRNEQLYFNHVQSLGWMYHDLGEYAKAEPYLLKSLYMVRDALGEESPQYIKSLRNMAEWYFERGDFLKSIPLYTQLAEGDLIQYGEKSSQYGWDFITLGIIYVEISDFEKSEEYLLKGTKIFKEVFGEMSEEYAIGLNGLATLYDDLGDFEKAELMYLQVMSIFKQLKGEKSRGYATGLHNLAVLYDEMGKLDESEKLYNQVIAIRKEILGENDIDYASSLNGLAQLYFEKGDFNSAEPLFIEAISIFKRVGSDVHIHYAQTHFNLAYIYLTTHFYKEAEAVYLEGIQALEKGIGEDNVSYILGLNGLATLYFTMGNYPKSDQYIKKAITLAKEVVGEYNNTYGSLLNNYANMKGVSGDPKLASQLFEKSDSIFMDNLSGIFRFTSESEKLKYLLSVNDYFMRSQNFYYKSYKTIPGSSLNALNLQLSTHGSVLSSVIQLKQEVLSGKNDSLQNVYADWEKYNNKISKELSLPIASRHPELSSWQDELNRLEKQLSRMSQAFKNISTSSQPTYRDIKRALKQDEVAIEFLSFNHYHDQFWTDSMMYSAILIRPEDSVPVYVPLFDETQLKGLFKGDSIRTFANLLYSEAQVRDVEHDISYGDSLFQLIWDPLEPFLNNKKHIYYSPAGLLYKINFDAVSLSDDLLLSDKYHMQRVISVTKLTEPAANSFTPTSISLFGGIQYNMDVGDLKNLSDNTKKIEEYNLSYFRSSDDSSRGGGFNYLPGSESEVLRIQDAFKKNNISTKMFVGKYGSEEAFKQLTANNSPSILHLSTHGFFFSNRKKKNTDQYGLINEPVFTSADDPLFRSGLIMSGADYAWKGNEPLKGVEDGILTAHEISGLYMPNTKLVVLSACETGLGDIHGNEGVYGLQRAFKMAGVDYMIMTLWQVLDKETSEFMVLFYQNLLTKKSIPVAFKITQDTMKNKYRDEPYKWAGFVLVH